MVAAEEEAVEEVAAVIVAEATAIVTAVEVAATAEEVAAVSHCARGNMKSLQLSSFVLFSCNRLQRRLR